MGKILRLTGKYENTITGGHSYNASFFNKFSDLSGLEIVYLNPNFLEKYNGWKKVLAPILELKLLNKIKHNDIVFMGDTAYMYHLILLMLIRLFKKTKTVVIIHHFPFLEKSSKDVSYYIQKIYYSLCKYIIVPSPYTMKEAKQLYPKKQITYIPIPFIQTYTPSNEYVKGNILYVGTIEHRKGLIYLIKAAKELVLQNVKFHIDIVGKVVNQSYYNNLQNYILENNLNEYVTFHGRVSEQELNNLYSCAELFVLPSLLEGYGIVLVEAMQRGLPIVAFDNSAMPFTVKNDVNGYLAKNKDYKDLAYKIIQLLGNESKRIKMQNNIKHEINTLKTELDFIDAIKDFFNMLN